jgi:hypothetical protein
MERRDTAFILRAIRAVVPRTARCGVVRASIEITLLSSTGRVRCETGHETEGIVREIRVAVNRGDYEIPVRETRKSYRWTYVLLRNALTRLAHAFGPRPTPISIPKGGTGGGQTGRRPTETSALSTALPNGTMRAVFDDEIAVIPQDERVWRRPASKAACPGCA